MLQPFRFSKLGSLLVALITFLPACNDAQKNPDADRSATTVILVRHAEKQAGDDPELTAGGRERAKRLRDRLRDTDLQAVYSSDYKRTRQTAQPTAAAQKMEIEIYDPGKPEEMASKLLSRHEGGTVLVVGHSNSTPALANALLGDGTLPRFSEDDYGNILTVKVNGEGVATLTQARY